MKKNDRSHFVHNPVISSEDILTLLSNEAREWKWEITKDNGEIFEIQGKKRWHKTILTRNSNGNIFVSFDDSLLWTICTLGATAVISEFLSSETRYRSKFLKLLKENIKL